MTTQMAVDKGVNFVNGSEVVKTSSGTVNFINTNLVSEKTVYAITSFLNDLGSTSNGTYSFIFRMDGYPRETPSELTTWMFFPDSCAAVCNLVDCVDLSFTVSMYRNRKARYLNVKSMIWLNIIKGAYHETHHAIEYINRREALETSKKTADAEEILACKYATETFVEQIKRIDLEPEFSQEMEEFIAVVWNEHVERIEKLQVEVDNETLKGIELEKALSDIEWLSLQREMIDKELVMYVPRSEDIDGISISTVKEYIAYTVGAKLGDAGWDLPTIGIFSPPECTTEEVPVHVQSTTPVYVQQPAPIYTQQIQDDYEDEPSMMVAENDYQAGPTYNQTPGFQGVYNYAEKSQTISQQTQPVYTQYKQSAQPLPQPAPQRPVQQPAPQPTVNNNYPSVLTDEMMPSIMKGLYLKLFSHIFQQCTFDSTKFVNKDNIKVRISLTPQESEVITSMTCLGDNNKRIHNVQVTDWITGTFIDNANELPGYNFSITTPSGRKINRRLLPQNPNKTKDGINPSGTAARAARGEQILWILDPDASAADKPFSTRIINGVLEGNYEGRWSPL